MKNSLFIILGNQQFPLSNIKKYKDTHNFFMAEVNELCTHFKYHKQKILFFLSSMREYKNLLEENDYSLTYHSLTKKNNGTSYTEYLDQYIMKHKSVKKITCFEVEDIFFEETISNYCKRNKIELEVIPSPMFMTSREDFKEYLASVKRPFMKTFYERQRKKYEILTVANKPVGGKWSYDEDNRKKIPKGVIPPPSDISCL